MGRGSQATPVAVKIRGIAHFPEWLQSWIQENGRYLYHGTGDPQTRRLILEEGLKPWNHLDSSVWSHEPTYLPRPDMVYLADKMTSHELRGTHVGGHLLAIDLTKLEPDNFFPDEDAFYSEVMKKACLGWEEYGFEDPNITVKDAFNANNQSEAYPLEKRPYKNYGQWAEANMLGSDPRHAQLSLTEAGLLAHRGRVPAEALLPAKMENYYDPDNFKIVLEG